MSHSAVAQDTEHAGFVEMQRLAYAGAQAVAATLEPGVTERQAARRLRDWLHDHGVQDWFHTPFAWFGDRTAFRNFRTPLQFFPSNRRLEDGMPFILDCAPVRDTYVADIGYAGRIGDNPVHDQLMTDLAEYRTLILEQVRQRRPLREIYVEVDALITRQGYDNRHQVYPGRVIAHQVARVHSRLPQAIVAGFGVRALQTLLGDLLVERLHHRSPLWADGKISQHAPTPGLWAVEPHIAFRGVGVKFEEMLVVTEDDAYWLDDAVPHVQRWRGTT
ncbi:M24 family metallopeptidase [Lipingzhangella sp. LS1_29]|uniref:M24 family metallopeptidase n=1 Tax=Lipingzhangella rawalii TaxID=2055835 RepID=A0ABU2H901_9ACTN|nr:M24 family metallopeptidase [Lipingzhangella rawalii]MDS1271784.1 M24 family metallopeptidase [Lipingzhangella rawalii]